MGDSILRAGADGGIPFQFFLGLPRDIDSGAAPGDPVKALASGFPT
jgi:hypothetical protein